MPRDDREPIDDLIRRAVGRAPARRGLRASDADRETTAELLRRNHGEGRIDTPELEERIERCYSAKTLGELDELIADLPEGRQRARPDRSRRPARPLAFLVPLVPIVAVIAVVSVATGFVPWFVFPLAFFVFPRFMYGRHHRRYRGRFPAPRQLPR
jgi:Flp pilus assembly protein TadB